MKVVINNCFGGFGLSAAAECMYAKLAGFELFRYKQTKYKHRDGEDLYEKIEADGDDIFLSFTLTKDHGPSFPGFPEGGYWYSRDIERNDPFLIEVVEALEDKASGLCANLKVVDVPDGVEWEIEEYNGSEHISEAHRSWS